MTKRMLARIAYNTEDWRKPTKKPSGLESAGTYSARHGFGHEEWLFRTEWQIDGWRYAFIEGFNKNRHAYIGRPLDVTLFTIQPDKQRRLVATIYDLESLNDQQAADALDAFRSNGWLNAMQDEIRAIGGNVAALGDPKWANQVLNIRYRLENLDRYPPDTFLPENDWIKKRHRYLLYKFEDVEWDRVERSVAGRSGTQVVSEARRLFRRGTKPVEYTPEHRRMQVRLLNELQQEYGRQSVWCEQDYVDVRVETDKELIFFEIKTDLDPRAVIRQALGQILEYAYHPARSGRRPERLVIVGRNPLGCEDRSYLEKLCQMFNLPLSYRVITI